MAGPRLIENLSEWFEIRKSLAGRRVGFVPTMGALHAGHASLLQRSRSENDVSVLSIYVNPTQFNNANDLEKYPSTLKSDQITAEKTKTDYIILPTYPQIYPDHYRYKLSESDVSTRLCGAHRPGHFDGVLTVVMRLFNIVRPDRAYFGEKDYQQLQLVKGLASAFFLDLEVIGCPTLREPDGLAMSSRNMRLSTEERQLAPRFYEILSTAPDVSEARQLLERAGFSVEYVEDLEGRRFAAVQLGSVRLIDNVQR